jgi:hypothetical protein
VTQHFTDDAAWQEQAARAHREVHGFLAEIEAMAVVEP